ncbi:uncharacterized protein LOC120359310 [Solenopsis invicta]|uniref:uncharacterized protein LOC120359310 n=1 Tax=Solenopsis invicta TaxID=13686 RepID=UPI00193E6741|nr:uncharacterized protein LOC120359310 [Solenopsis invicta]
MRCPGVSMMESAKTSLAFRLTRAIIIIIVVQAAALFCGAIKPSVYRENRPTECRKTRRQSELSTLRRLCTGCTPRNVETAHVSLRSGSSRAALHRPRLAESRSSCSLGRTPSVKSTANITRGFRPHFLLY